MENLREIKEFLNTVADDEILDFLGLSDDELDEEILKNIEEL